jgi:hypothetical protein
MIDIGDGGLFSSEPCGPPCFWRIIPGKSTEAEVLQVLKDNQVIDFCKHYNTENESGSRGLTCGFEINISFQYGQEIVEGIGLRPEGISLEEVIAFYGDPDGVLVLSGGTSQEHPPIVVMSLYYDKIQTRIHLPDQEGAEYFVEGLDLITDVSYFDASSYQSMKEEQLQRWKGYGNYQPSY